LVGRYYVEFFGCETPDYWTTQWYPDQQSATDATPVTVKLGVGAGPLWATMKEALPQPGVIEGEVLKSPHGGPLSGVCVAAFAATTPSGTPVMTATTNGIGHYTMTVPGGSSYLVDFGGCGGLPADLQPQWYQNKPSEATATPVDVPQNSRVAAIDAALLPTVTP
jgi:hypothetical protein